MVPVRKPGRPLSSCPHPASKPCTCGAVTAAIPRKQKCGCGSSEKSEKGTSKPEVEDEPDVLTTSPGGDSRAGASSFRVQKPAPRRGSTRKPSMDPAGLEKMDPAQLNILPAFNGPSSASVGVDKSPTDIMNGTPSYGGVGIAAADSTYTAHPMMYPMFPQPMPSPMMHSGPLTPTTNGRHSTASNGHKAASATPSQGSCCGGGGARADSEEGTEPLSISKAPSTVSDDVDKPAKSCCSSKKTANNNSHSNMTAPLASAATSMQAQQQHHAAMMMSPFQIPMPVPNGMYPFYPHPTVFTYPPQYGTFMQPLQPDQWRQMMAAFSFGQAPPQPTFDMNGAAPTPGAYSTTPELQNKNSGTSHHCTCGESCNCVGCAAHPYNEATQSYVRSAWNSMMEEQTNGSRPTTNGHNHHETSASHTPNETTAASAVPGGGAGPGSEPHTPSDATSVLAEEQTLSANDFFFVSYPFDSCAGDTASCPCGDDCQCIGCVIHNNPGPEEITQTS